MYFILASVFLQNALQSYTHPTPLRKLSVLSFNCCLTRTNSTLVIKDVAADKKLINAKNRGWRCGGSWRHSSVTCFAERHTRGTSFHKHLAAKTSTASKLWAYISFVKVLKVFLKALSARARSGHRCPCPLRDKPSWEKSQSHGVTESRTKVTDKVTGKVLQMKVTTE